MPDPVVDEDIVWNSGQEIAITDITQRLWVHYSTTSNSASAYEKYRK